MAENKTKQTDASVDVFLESISDEKKRADSRAIVALMARVTGEPAKMWGESIVGFGFHHYKYASGREGDMCLVGFSPRKQNLTVYLWYGFESDHELMKRLGKHKVGKACLYFNKLEDIDISVLEILVENTFKYRSLLPG